MCNQCRREGAFQTRYQSDAPRFECRADVPLNEQPRTRKSYPALLTPIVLMIALLFAACGDTGDDTLPLEQFTPRPVMIQAALQDCEAQCESSLSEAQLFWIDRGVTLTVEEVDGDVTSQLGIAVPGVIALRCGKLSTFPEKVHGETSYYHSIGGAILAAEVVLASCEPLTLAHELGHALMGPQHREVTDNLMRRDLDKAGWDLEPDQLADARDP